VRRGGEEESCEVGGGCERGSQGLTRECSYDIGKNSVIGYMGLYGIILGLIYNWLLQSCLGNRSRVFSKRLPLAIFLQVIVEQYTHKLRINFFF
jgi:hypothetical protein